MSPKETEAIAVLLRQVRELADHAKAPAPVPMMAAVVVTGAYPMTEVPGYVADIVEALNIRAAAVEILSGSAGRLLELNDEVVAKARAQAVCRDCKREHGLASWRTMPIVGCGPIGTRVDGKETATHVVQSRRYPCGATATIQLPLPTDTSPGQASAMLVLLMMGELS